jgi:hypothetical protein
MRCTQEQFDNIKDKINLPIEDIDNFNYYVYLTNFYGKLKKVTNIHSYIPCDTSSGCREVIEAFDAEYFLDCCGREKPDEEVIFSGADMQYRCGDENVWKNCNDEVEYRMTPKPNLDSDIEALQEKAKELGLKVTVIIE